MMRGNLLMMRWLLLNNLIAVLAAIGYKHGLLQAAWLGDTTYVTTAILAFLVIGLGGTAFRIWQASRMLDSLGGSGSYRVAEFQRSGKDSSAVERLRSVFHRGVRPYAWLARVMVMLGFLGTVWGMGEALAGIATANVGDAAAAAQILSSMVAGFNIALWTTKTGIICYFVLMFNVQLMMGGYERLFSKLLEE